MGQGCMGPFLELGSERDVGSGDMALLCFIHTFKASRTNLSQGSVSASDHFVPMPSDVLVGNQLPPFSSGERAFILISILIIINILLSLPPLKEAAFYFAKKGWPMLFLTTQN